MRAPLFPDLTLLAITVGLVVFGIVMLYSTTANVAETRFGDSLFYVRRQIAAAIVGFAALFFVARMRIEMIERWVPAFFGLSVILLGLTFVPGLGDAAGGAQRWLKLGPIRFQPGEFVKLGVILFLARYWARQHEVVSEPFRGLLLPLGIVAAVAAMFLKQPDFGSSSIIFLCALGMSLIAGVRLRYLFVGASMAMVAAAILVLVSPYRMARIASFLSPLSDPAGRGYQLIQSLVAVSSGGMSGVGLGESQQKLFFLPAAHTDFIFSVIAEELGFVGAIAIMSAFLALLFRGLRLARSLEQGSFSSLVVVGGTLLVVIPAMLNIGVVTGLLPTKGLVLPFVGYGGSSLLSSLVTIGLIFSAKSSGSVITGHSFGRSVTAGWRASQ